MQRIITTLSFVFGIFFLAHAEPISIEKPVFDHSPWDKLLKKHVSAEGNVNYQGFKNDKEAFENYLSALSQNAPTDSWSRAEKLAYWINVYNAFTVKLIIDNYPLESIKDIKKPWDQEFFKIAGKPFNLNKVEHEILREMGEPRIHFAINCASFSCPRLFNEAFSADKLEDQLQKAAIGFVNDKKRNQISTDEVEISKIFRWFSKDFEKEGDIIDFLNKYSKVKINSKAKVRYKDYDWTLNK